MEPSNLNNIAIIIAERVEEYSTRDRYPEAKWPEIKENIRLEVIDAFRQQCIANEDGHIWICTDNIVDHDCVFPKKCHHCNIWESLCENTKPYKEGRVSEAENIVRQNPELMDDMGRRVAVVRSKSILKTISESSGMKVPLDEINQVLKFRAYQD